MACWGLPRHGEGCIPPTDVYLADQRLLARVLAARTLSTGSCSLYSAHSTLLYSTLLALPYLLYSIPNLALLNLMAPHPLRGLAGGSFPLPHQKPYPCTSPDRSSPGLPCKHPTTYDVAQLSLVVHRCLKEVLGRRERETVVNECTDIYTLLLRFACSCLNTLRNSSLPDPVPPPPAKSVPRSKRPIDTTLKNER